MRVYTIPSTRPVQCRNTAAARVNSAIMDTGARDDTPDTPDRKIFTRVYTIPSTRSVQCRNPRGLHGAILLLMLIL